MNDPHPKLFETLEPPRGGLARLRSRVERDARGRSRVRRMHAVAATGLLLAFVGLTVFGPEGKREPLPPEFLLARIQLGLVAPPSEPMTIAGELRGELAAQRVPLATDEVVFYRIASLRRTGAKRSSP